MSWWQPYAPSGTNVRSNLIADSWATSGLDLHLDRTGSRVRAGLEGALREAIRDGRLAPGTRLPSSRALAADLAIARNTVTEAYAQLVAEGWLSARRGSGTRVMTGVPAPGSADRSSSPAGLTASPAARTPPMARTPPVALPPPSAHRARATPDYDLSPGRPDLAGFPRTRWLAAARRALASAAPRTLGYTDARGLLELRTAVAEYLARARGVRAHPDRVAICAGFTQGWMLLCEALANRGVTTVAMERHGIVNHRRIAARQRLRIRDLAVDASGAVIAPGDASAMLLTPAHQFPMGVALAPERRAQAIGWAKDHGGLVIEDDYDGEFRYDRQPVGAMQALAPEHVVYAGTVSKSLAPGLRLGWLVLPAELVYPIAEAQAVTLGGVSAMDQLTLAELISSGGYDRHVRRARLAYRRRRDQLLATVERHAPRLELTGIAAGLHALLTLPVEISERSVIDAAEARGLAVDGLAHFTSGDAPRPGALVIGYATPPEHAYAAALARLDASLAEATGAAAGLARRRAGRQRSPHATKHAQRSAEGRSGGPSA